jgi:hypothetical protein
MEMIGDDDWALFLDADATFTTPDYYQQIETIVEIIEKKDLNIGLLTACTNRIGNAEQIVFPKNSPEAYNHDIDFHRKVGKEIQEKNRNTLIKCNDPISGVVLLLPKRVWQQTPGFVDGFLSVDNHIDYDIRKLNYDTGIMTGVYVYHWYRADWKETGGLRPTGYE